MRSPPTDEDEEAELAALNPAPWMRRFLDLNPSYTGWGPHEDYMAKKGEGWDSRIESSWAGFLGTEKRLDNWNEIVHFYFQIGRDSERCDPCGGCGLNPASREISETFYDHGDLAIDFTAMIMTGGIDAFVKAQRPEGATGRLWCDKITQDEVDALLAANRLRYWGGREAGWISGPLTADEVNAANLGGAGGVDGLRHDGINRMILVETRCKRLGVWGNCEKCDGHGYVFTSEDGYLDLVLWMLHPRKGASRGVRIMKLSEAEAKETLGFLRRAAERNAERFAKVVAL